MPNLSCAWCAASQLPASTAAYQQGCAGKSGAKSQNEQVLRRWEEEELSAGECHSDIPCASGDTPCAGRPGRGYGRTAGRTLPLLVRLLGKICEFFSGETAQDGQTWQQGGPAKGQGLPGALLWATLWEQRGRGVSVQVFFSFQNPRAGCCEAGYAWCVLWCTLTLSHQWGN